MVKSSRSRSSVKHMALAAAGAAVVALAPAIAEAQEQGGPTAPGQPAPVYPTPLYQQTQGTYVPQSVAMSGPRVITDYQEGDPIPPGYRESTRTRTGLVVGGAVLFGTLWMFSALGAAVSSDTGTDASALYIPGVGPFLEMGKTTTATGNFFNVVDGIGQCAGIAMLVYGLSSPRHVLVRNDLGKPTIIPMPFVAKEGGGMGVVGLF